MIKLKRTYRLLRPLNDSVVDWAMAEALPTAEAEVQHLLVLSLLARNDPSAPLALVHHLHLLSPPLQQLIVAEERRLDPVMRTAAEHAEPTTRLNVIDLITRSQGFRLAYLVSAQLHHSDSRVRRAAAAALLNLAHLLDEAVGRAPAVGQETAEAGPTAPPTSTPAPTRPQLIRWLTAALTEGCSCYHQHGRQDVIAAAATLGPARPRSLMQQLTDRRCAAHAVVRDMIRRADRPEIQHALLSYASLAALEPMVVESLAQPQIALALPLIWPTAHLLAVPDVRSAVRRVTAAEHLLPTEATLGGLPLPTQRLVPRWITAVRGSRAGQAEALAALAAADDRVTRLLALRALGEVDDPAADEQVAPLCFDAEPIIARMALRHLRRRQWPGLTRLMVRLVSSPHADVRRLAERELAPVGFERLWRHWQQMEQATRLSAGRAVLKIDRRFHEQLGDKLRSDDSADRFKAVMMVRTLGVESHHEQALMHMLDDTDPRVASASARALGALAESPGVTDRLGEALRHEDDRVRANAIESLEHLGQAEQVNATLRDLAERAGNRTRATAIAALMKMPLSDALPELIKMLSDERPEHRASALWAVQELDLAPLARQVVDLARRDSDRGIRRQALEVYRHVLEQAEPAEPAAAELSR